MTGETAVAAGGEGGAGEEVPQSQGRSFLSRIFTMLIYYFIFSKFISPKKSKGGGQPQNEFFSNALHDGQTFDVYMHLVSHAATGFGNATEPLLSQARVSSAKLLAFLPNLNYSAGESFMVPDGSISTSKIEYTVTADDAKGYTTSHVVTTLVPHRLIPMNLDTHPFYHPHRSLTGISSCSAELRPVPDRLLRSPGFAAGKPLGNPLTASSFWEGRYSDEEVALSTTPLAVLMEPMTHMFDEDQEGASLLGGVFDDEDENEKRADQENATSTTSYPLSDLVQFVKKHEEPQGWMQWLASRPDTPPQLMFIRRQIQMTLVHDTTVHKAQDLSVTPLNKFMGDYGIVLRHRFYYPPLYQNDFWLREGDYAECNDTMIGQPIDITLHWNVLGNHRWMLQQSMESSKTEQGALFLMKRVILETHWVWLLLSSALSGAHFIFSALAFKSDIQFWKDREGMKGMSAGCVLIDFFSLLVTGLYLLDTKTSRLVVVEIAVAVAISAWKIPKAVKIVRAESFPFFSIEDAPQYVESATKEYDRIAVRYLSYFMGPCVLGMGVYSLLYHKYRSWYSFVIRVLAGTQYVFGFILMFPQLYINYRLKSVEHMPWKVLVYKGLSSFVDDIFPFLLKVPWLHRIAALRNDAIFLIYVYQRWVYRVDVTRGFYADPSAAAAAKKTDGDVPNIEEVTEEVDEPREGVRQRQTGAGTAEAPE